MQITRFFVALKKKTYAFRWTNQKSKSCGIGQQQKFCSPACHHPRQMKKTNITLPIYIPEPLRKECAVHLEQEQEISDLIKISYISDCSKLYKGYQKDWIVEDILENIDIGQYGGQEGLGTEHLVVCHIILNG